MDLNGPTGRVGPLKTWDEYKHTLSPLCGLSYPPAPPPRHLQFCESYTGF